MKGIAYIVPLCLLSIAPLWAQENGGSEPKAATDAVNITDPVRNTGRFRFSVFGGPCLASPMADVASSVTQYIRSLYTIVGSYDSPNIDKDTTTGMELGAEAGYRVTPRIGVGLRYVRMLTSDLKVGLSESYLDPGFSLSYEYNGLYSADMSMVQGGVWIEGGKKPVLFRGFLFVGPVMAQMKGHYNEELSITTYVPTETMAITDEADWTASGNGSGVDIGGDLAYQFTSNLGGFLGASYTVADVSEAKCDSFTFSASDPSFRDYLEAYGVIPARGEGLLNPAGNPIHYDFGGIRIRGGLRLML